MIAFAPPYLAKKHTTENQTQIYKNLYVRSIA
jgi:hypothetical protein